MREVLERAITGVSVTFDRPKPIVSKEAESKAIGIFLLDDTLVNRQITEAQGMKYFRIEQVPDKIVACESYLEVNLNPLQHEGSESLYFIDMFVGDDRILLSYLPPKMLTSELHWHPGETKMSTNLIAKRPVQKESAAETYLRSIATFSEENRQHPEVNEIAGESILPPISEDYEILFGKPLIHHSEGDRGYPVPQAFTVESFIRHRMESGEEGSVFAIRMRNAALYPEELQHVHI